jgi:hypothetical protein
MRFLFFLSHLFIVSMPVCWSLIYWNARDNSLPALLHHSSSTLLCVGKLGQDHCQSRQENCEKKALNSHAQSLSILGTSRHRRLAKKF